MKIGCWSIESLFRKKERFRRIQAKYSKNTVFYLSRYSLYPIYFSLHIGKFLSWWTENLPISCSSLSFSLSWELHSIIISMESLVTIVLSVLSPPTIQIWFFRILPKFRHRLTIFSSSLWKIRSTFPVFVTFPTQIEARLHNIQVLKPLWSKKPRKKYSVATLRERFD